MGLIGMEYAVAAGPDTVGITLRRLREYGSSGRSCAEFPPGIRRRWHRVFSHNATNLAATQALGRHGSRVPERLDLVGILEVFSMRSMTARYKGALVGVVAGTLLLTGCSGSSSDESQETTQQAIAELNAALSDVIGDEATSSPSETEDPIKSAAGIWAMTEFGSESLDSWGPETVGQFCADGSTGVEALASLLHDRFPEYTLSDAREAARDLSRTYC